MVAKIISGKNIGGALNYNEHKVDQGKAELIGQNGFQKDIQHLNFYDKLQRFTNLTMRNQRTKTNSVHISLNFAVGEKIPDSKLIEIADQYMKEIGFSDQPYLVYAHNDAGHPHVHIVTTNIKSTGERISLHNLGKTKSEEARKEIELQFGLIPARQAEVQKTENQGLSKVNYGKDDTKRAISNVVRGVVNTYKFASLPELNAALSCYNVAADRGSKNSTMYAKKGLLYWALDEKGRKVGIPIKASSIYSSPTLKNLERKFESNKKRKGTQKDQLRTSIDWVMKAKASPAGFQQALSSKGIDVLFRRNEEGRLYGVTFIDHNTRSVFNGSDLGKTYSANALNQWFGNTKTIHSEYTTSKQKYPVPALHMKEVLAYGTLKNYFTTVKYLKEFLLKQFKKSDIYLNELDYQFITQFEYFLRTYEPTDHHKGMANNGVMKHLERFRKMIRLGVKLGWIEKNPFELYKLKMQKVERDFLTSDELFKIEKKEFSVQRIQYAKDLFVFSCYTGIAYIDVMQLTPDNILLGTDGNRWIKTMREKTDTSVNVPILPKAAAIIEKYKDNPRAIVHGTLFPVISNQKLNSYLKEVADLCGIKKHLTFHLARHTFATSVTLSNGVPIETVSKMLGHTTIRTTQIYAKVIEQKVSQDMANLRNRLEENEKSNLKVLKGARL